MIFILLIHLLLSFFAVKSCRELAYQKDIGEWWDREQMFMYILGSLCPFINIMMIYDAEKRKGE